MVQCSCCSRRRVSRNCSITLQAAAASFTVDLFTVKKDNKVICSQMSVSSNKIRNSALYRVWQNVSPCLVHSNRSEFWSKMYTFIIFYNHIAVPKAISLSIFGHMHASFLCRIEWYINILIPLTWVPWKRKLECEKPFCNKYSKLSLDISRL